MVRALAVIAICAGVAHADKLADAKKELEAVRYDDAQKLLLAALQEGGNSPAALAEIYKLAASTAIVLGQRDVAEQYYRRWIAIDPHAALPQTLAPKLREPFVAAQAYMAAHGQLVVRLSRRSATEVDIAVESDPLAMVAAVAIAPGAPVRLGVDRTAHLVAPAAAREVVVQVLDETGNHVRELAAPEPAAQPPPPPPPPPPLAPTPVKTPLYRNWIVYAVPAGASFVVAAGFGLAAGSANGSLGNVITNHGFYSDALADERRRDHDASIANGFFLGAAVLGAAAVIVYVTRPNEGTTVVPSAAPGAVGVTVSHRW